MCAFKLQSNNSRIRFDHKVRSNNFTPQQLSHPISTLLALEKVVGTFQEPLQEELPPRRAAEKAAEAACQEVQSRFDVVFFGGTTIEEYQMILVITF